MSSNGAQKVKSPKKKKAAKTSEAIPATSSTDVKKSTKPRSSTLGTRKKKTRPLIEGESDAAPSSTKKTKKGSQTVDQAPKKKTKKRAAPVKENSKASVSLVASTKPKPAEVDDDKNAYTVDVPVSEPKKKDKEPEAPSSSSSAHNDYTTDIPDSRSSTQHLQYSIDIPTSYPVIKKDSESDDLQYVVEVNGNKEANGRKEAPKKIPEPDTGKSKGKGKGKGKDKKMGIEQQTSPSTSAQVNYATVEQAADNVMGQNQPVVRKSNDVQVDKAIQDAQVDSLRDLVAEIFAQAQTGAPIDPAVLKSKVLQRTNPGKGFEVTNSKGTIDGKNWCGEWWGAFETGNFWKLYEVEQDFVYVSSATAKQIIQEIALPNDKKTIKPVDVGGLAGGMKFIRNGILYKLAQDVILNPSRAAGEPALWMYGGTQRMDEYAIKAAGRELNNLMYFATGFIPALRYPLMTLIDFCGYRVLATTLLPIAGQKTLKYGSCDGGKTVLADNQDIVSAMKLFGKKLGLAEHLVKDKQIVGPGDIEVHEGFDKKYYVLDFGRMMPPEAPPLDPEVRKLEPRSVFYKLLRPFLVSFWYYDTGKPLSSDAFTGWGRFDPRKDDFCNEVVKASQYLKGEHLQKCIRQFYLSDMWQSYLKTTANNANKPSSSDDTTAANEEYEQLVKLANEFTNSFHGFGINYRHLGLARQFARTFKSEEQGGSEHRLEKIIMTLAVVRVMQNQVKSQFREIREEVMVRGAPSEQPYKEAIANHLNKMFNYLPEGESATYWKSTQPNSIKAFLMSKFGGTLTEEEMDSSVDIRDKIDLKLAFVYLNSILGAVLLPSFQLSMWDTYQSRANHPGQRVLFMSTDILSVKERIRGMGLGKIFTAIKSYTLYKDLIAKSAAQASLQDKEDKIRAQKHLEYATVSLGETFTYVSTCVTANTWSSLTLLESAKQSIDRSPAKSEWLLSQAVTRLSIALTKEQSKEMMLILSGALKVLSDLQKQLGNTVKSKMYKKEARAAKKKAMESTNGESWARCQYVVNGNWAGLTEEAPAVLEGPSYFGC